LSQARTSKGVALNGSGQYVGTGAALLDTGGNRSAGAWVKLNAADGPFETVVSQDGDRDSAFFLQHSGQDQRFAMSFSGLRALAPAKPNQWYHLTGVRDVVKDELKLYLDGTVDQVHVYDRALTDAEVRTLCDSGR